MLKNPLNSLWNYVKHYTSHRQLREIAITLNYFCIIEISIVIFFSWQSYELLQWYKSIMTIDKFDGMAFWGAVSGLIAAVFGAVKYINDTFSKRQSYINKEDDK